VAKVRVTEIKSIGRGESKYDKMKQLSLRNFVKNAESLFVIKN